MTEPRSVVITGASRGLGLASAAHLYRRGWQVVAAVRTPDAALDRLREATGAGDGDPRLAAVRLDLDDPASVAAAAKAVEAAVGAPYAVVHNAAFISVGCVEEMPVEVWERIFSTNLFGAVRFTQALLPSMRAAGRGRIVVVSSQGGIRGLPTISAYSASKGALERWLEALTEEVAPFGIGGSVVVAGMFDTALEERTHAFADFEGPYQDLHVTMRRNGMRLVRFARRPEQFAPVLEKALNERRPFSRRTAGPDAKAMALGVRLTPAGIFRAVSGRAMGLPAPGSLSGHPVRLADLNPPPEERATDV